MQQIWQYLSHGNIGSNHQSKIRKIAKKESHLKRTEQNKRPLISLSRHLKEEIINIVNLPLIIA